MMLFNLLSLQISSFSYVHLKHKYGLRPCPHKKRRVEFICTIFDFTYLFNRILLNASHTTEGNVNQLLVRQKSVSFLTSCFCDISVNQICAVSNKNYFAGLGDEPSTCVVSVGREATAPTSFFASVSVSSAFSVPGSWVSPSSYNQ